MSGKQSERDFYFAIGARVRVAREVRGLSQAKLAKAIKLTRTSIVNVEAGRQAIPLHRLRDLCRTLNVTYKLLLDGHSK